MLRLGQTTFTAIVAIVIFAVVAIPLSARWFRFHCFPQYTTRMIDRVGGRVGVDNEDFLNSDEKNKKEQ